MIIEENVTDESIVIEISNSSPKKIIKKMILVENKNSKSGSLEKVSKCQNGEEIRHT